MSCFAECGGCGFLFGDSLSNASRPNIRYEGDDDSPAIAKLIGEEKDRRTYYQNRYRKIMGHLQKRGSVLEIGVGAGGFLKVFQEKGWNVEGIEPSEALRRFARESLGAEDVIHGADLAEVDEMLNLKPYDLIVALDVIEHLPDPWLLPMKALGWLSEGGTLVLQTPNAKSLRRYLEGSRWEQWAPGEHFCLHTSKSLMILLARSGFRSVQLKTLSGTAVDGVLRRSLMKPIGPVLNGLGLGNGLWALARKGAP